MPFLAQRAVTALRADSLRSSRVIAAARAVPPFLPPLRPNFEKYSRNSSGIFAMPSVYAKSAHVVNERINLTYVSGLRIVADMNTLTSEKQVSIIHNLLEGSSIRSTERLTGVHRDTIMRLLVRVGEGCNKLLDERVRNVHAKEVQVDEIWTYVFKKQARIIGNETRAGIGDQYVFIGLDAQTKLVISHLVGKRDGASAYHFMRDLKERLATRVQLTTDGFSPYVAAVDDTFGTEVDYAQLVKVYGRPIKQSSQSRNWYESVRVIGAIPTAVMGSPRMAAVSTSYIERQNLTMRMQMRRFTRLTNGHSKKLENLKAAIALHFAWYNFCRVHSTLRVTPAMEAGIASEIWPLERLVV